MRDQLVMLPCVLFIAILFAWPATSATLRADLTHVDSGRGFTKRELLSRMASRSTARAASLSTSAQAVTAPVARGTTGKEDAGSEYLIHFSIGTPSPQPVALTLDTGSDLIWTQCECTACFEQPFPVFDPSVSGTFGNVSCTDPICSIKGGLPAFGCIDNLCAYAYGYGDNSITKGTIYQDTFTFNGTNTDVAVPSLRFGCGRNNSGTFTSNESGIAGFGRGPLSLPSQLNISMFSYCFTTIVDPGSSPVFLGTPDNLGANIQSTPFVPNPATAPSPFYYLSLQGVTVGDTLLPFNASVFALKDDSSGGTFIDSGTSITSLPQAVFQSLKEVFVSQVPLPVANFSAAPDMLCFSTAQAADPKTVPVPKLTFHLEGADWDLPRENYVLDVEDTGSALLCVVIFSAGDSNTTTIGNFQQQNMHILYDLEANKMVFAPASCDQL